VAVEAADTSLAALVAVEGVEHIEAAGVVLGSSVAMQIQAEPMQMAVVAAAASEDIVAALGSASVVVARRRQVAAAHIARVVVARIAPAAAAHIAPAAAARSALVVVRSACSAVSAEPPPVALPEAANLRLGPFLFFFFSHSVCTPTM